ncbi:hypothetical protein PNEG_03381 [Pneumocystis murina B123]|uniref:Smr domain-containing protein n=1 Tax=Pneumocystis murina (strain B123) TaxID=1069680 RepID=M7NLY5_PNEMU|nr:hypothetical protein PNEG_03381 [Pneumocystis murina B123]EMR08212.1 hypothetical protein PNEG_03381 [Pneumocystis murina B123]
MKYHKNCLFKNESNPSISQRKTSNNDTLSFLQMIFPQQDTDVLKHIQEEYGNSLEKVINENLDIMDDDKNYDSLNDSFSKDSLEIPKTKRKKSKKIKNIPLDEWYKRNEAQESTVDFRMKPSLKWNDIIPNIEWLADIFNIPKKQAASIYHQSSVSLSKSVYNLLSSDYMIQRINESLVMLQHDYKSNLKQLKKQFPSLEEHMYSRILLSVENDLPKAISVVKTIQQSPIYIKDQNQTHHFNTSSSERHNHINDDYKSKLDNSSDDMIHTDYNLEECKANLSTFIFNRNHAFKEAAKAYRKAKTQGLYRDIVTYYSKKAQEYNSKVKLWNMRAKMCMIQNSLPSYLIDLHGLTIAEAIPLVKKAVAQWWSHEQKLQTDIPTPLEIITGAGLHSKNKLPKIKPSILQLLNKEGWLIEEKPGKIIVQSFQTNEFHTTPKQLISHP